MLIPKGTVHGAVNVRNVEKPVVHYTIGLSPEYKSDHITTGLASSVSKGSKYNHLIKPFDKILTPLETSRKMRENPEEALKELKKKNPYMDIEQVGLIGPGNGDTLVWLFGPQVENMDVNFTWGYYTQPGIWHRGGEAHTHPEEEILVYVGLDPDDINFMGAELELSMGEDYERHVFNKPTVAICPQGFYHLLLITRWVDKPYGFFVICLSGEHDSPWQEEAK